VAAEIGVKLDAPVEVRPSDPDDVASILLDPSQTQAAFGWRPTTQFSEGLRDLVAWYDAHGVEQTFSHLRGQR